jgi:hypothetical protein
MTNIGYVLQSQPSRRANNIIDRIDMNIEYQAGMLTTLESKHDNAGCRCIPVRSPFFDIQKFYHNTSSKIALPDLYPILVSLFSSDDKMSAV